MKIVIIGDGKVGYKLAKQLSSEKYDIISVSYTHLTLPTKA